MNLRRTLGTITATVALGVFALPGVAGAQSTTDVGPRVERACARIPVVALGASGLITIFHGDFARVGLWTGAVYAAGMLIILLAPSTGGKKLQD